MFNLSILIFKDDSQKTNENDIQEIFKPFNYTLQKVIRNTINIFDSYEEYISPTYKVKKPVRQFKEVSTDYYTTDEELIRVCGKKFFVGAGCRVLPIFRWSTT